MRSLSVVAFPLLVRYDRRSESCSRSQGYFRVSERRPPDGSVLNFRTGSAYSSRRRSAATRRRCNSQLVFRSQTLTVLSPPRLIFSIKRTPKHRRLAMTALLIRGIQIQIGNITLQDTTASSVDFAPLAKHMGASVTSHVSR
jgi:hypothetical protein